MKQMLSDCPTKIAQVLFSKELISETVKDSPSFEIIASNFQLRMKLTKDVSGLVEQCQSFLNCLSSELKSIQGQEAVKSLAAEWKEEVKKELDLLLPIEYVEMELDIGSKAPTETIASHNSPKHTISTPTIPELAELLCSLTKWQNFGMFLPNMTDDIIETIENDYRGTDRQRLALFSEWLRVYPKASWEDVIDALKKLRESKLVIVVQKYLSISQNYTTKELTLSSKDQLVTDIQQLHKKFASVVINVRKTIVVLVGADTAKLADIARFIEETNEIKGLTKLTSVDELFNEIQYCFLNCEVIEEIVNQFLSGSAVENELNDYILELEHFETSAELQHVKTAIEEALLPKKETTESSCEVIIKLNGKWRKETLKNFKKLIEYLFSGKRKLINHIRIEKGSICVRFLVPRLHSNTLVAIAKEKIELMELLGIFKIYIDNQPIITQNENENFSFDTSLLQAAKTGNNELTKLLLEFKINIDHQDEGSRCTALMLASEGGHKEVVHTLVSAGANINIQSQNGWTALLIASQMNFVAIVNELLLAQADINKQRDNGETPLMLACRRGHVEVVKLLLEFRADPFTVSENEDTAMSLAIQQNCGKIVDTLLDSFPNSYDYETLLLSACRYGHSGIILALIVKLPLTLPPEKLQLFILCTDGNQTSVANHISSYNIDVNCTLVKGITPLMIASACGHTGSVEVLLQLGANVNSTDNEGLTALVYAGLGEKSIEAFGKLTLAGGEVFFGSTGNLKALATLRKHRIFEQFEIKKKVLETIKDFQNLSQKFEGLTCNIKLVLESALSAGAVSVVEIIEHLQIYYDTNDFKCTESAEELFLNLQSYYYILNVDILEQIAMFVGNELLQEELKNYSTNLKAFEDKTPVEYLKLAMKSGLLPSQLDVTTDMAQVVIKFNNEWKDKKMSSMRKFLMCSFSRSSSFLSLNKMEDEGLACACVFLIPKSLVDRMMTMAIEQHEYQYFAGCYEVLIDGKQTLLKNQNDNFTFDLQTLPKSILKRGKSSFIDFILEMQFGNPIGDFNPMVSLTKAVKEGDDNSIDLLLYHQNADVNCLNEEGKSLLILACFLGHQSTVHTLVSSGANVNLQDNYGWTALMAACKENHLTIIRELVENGADLNIVDNNGHPAIYTVVASAGSFEDYLETLQLLITQPCVDKNTMNNDGVTTLMKASQFGLTEAVKLLLEHGADPNIQCNPSNITENPLTGFTALLFATVNNHLDIVKILLQAKANPNLQFKASGETPLMATENVDIIQVLLENGADPTIVDNNGNTAIHLTIYKAITSGCKDYLEILQLLTLQPNASLNKMNNTGMTSLMMASQHGLISAVRLLLNGGADVDVQCKSSIISENELNGYTALMFACVNGQLEVVHILLQAKANPDLQITNNGQTALMLAICRQEIQIVQLLLENGADLNIAKIDGETAIHVSVFNCLGISNEGILQLLMPNIDLNSLRSDQDVQSKSKTSEEILQLLVSHPNIELNLMSNAGLTCLMNASQFGLITPVRLLLQNGANPDIQCINTSVTDLNGFTALMFACQHGYYEIVQLLLKANANPNLLHNNGQTALMDAVNEGNLQIVQELLANGADASVCDIYGNSAFHYSLCGRCFRSPNHLKIVDLVAKPSVVNVTDKGGMTGLMLASMTGNSEAVKLLLSKEADLDIQQSSTLTSSDSLIGFTALMYACDRGYLEIARFLLQAKANPNIKRKVNGETALVYAIDAGSPDIVQQLLQYGADPNIMDENGFTAIYLAIQQCYSTNHFEKYLEIIQLLSLQPSTNLNVTNDFGFTCLMSACLIEDACNSMELVKLLLQKGANPNIQVDSKVNIREYIETMDRDGKYRSRLQKLGSSQSLSINGFTALMVGCHMGRLQVVKELLQAKANPNLQHEVSGDTALMWAVKGGHTDIVQELLKNGANPNISNQKGGRAIHIAVCSASTSNKENYLKIIQLLIQANADVNVLVDEWTPLMIASRVGNSRVAELLIEVNADVNIKNKHGTTCLMIACTYGHSQLSETLLNFKADSKILNNNSQTAFTLAACSGNIDLVKILLDKTQPSQIEIEKGLIQACYEGHPSMISFLVKQLPQLTNTQKELLFSCKEGDIGCIVKQVVECQVDPNTSLVCGLTPLMVALSCGHVDVVDLLIQTGADIDVKENIWGMTSLFFASSDALLDMLLENGADPNFIVNNQTLLDIANYKSQSTVSELLVQYGGQTFSQLQAAGLVSEKAIIPIVTNESTSPNTEKSDTESIYTSDATITVEKLLSIASTDQSSAILQYLYFLILQQRDRSASTTAIEMKEAMGHHFSQSTPLLTV